MKITQTINVDNMGDETLRIVLKGKQELFVRKDKFGNFCVSFNNITDNSMTKLEKEFDEASTDWVITDEDYLDQDDD